MSDIDPTKHAPDLHTQSGRRARGRPPAEAEPRRRRIIEAAIDLFIANGFVGATIAELARRSGLNKRTIYALVGDKEQIFRQVCRHVALNGGLDLTDAIDRADLRSSLINLGRRLLENSLSPQTIALEQTAVAASPLFPEFIDELVSSNYREANAKVAEFLMQLAQLGLLATEDEVADSELFFDLVIGQMAHRMVLGQSCAPADHRHLERRVDYFIKCIR